MKLVLPEGQTRTRNDCCSGILDLFVNILEINFCVYSFLLIDILIIQYIGL